MSKHGFFSTRRKSWMGTWSGHWVREPRVGNVFLCTRIRPWMMQRLMGIASSRMPELGAWSVLAHAVVVCRCPACVGHGMKTEEEFRAFDSSTF